VYSIEYGGEREGNFYFTLQNFALLLHITATRSVDQAHPNNTLLSDFVSIKKTAFLKIT
jgi:hypothetical protein